VEFVIARNPDAESSLPFLVRVPLGDGVALKVKDTWPRTAKIYCHRADIWPDDLDIVERIPVRSCVRRGAAIDLVLDRGKEFRSQFVFTVARGREMIFWQSARTTKQARPAVALPTARAQGRVLDILVDTHEQYPWTFTHQQATTSRRALPAGDYAVTINDRIIAAVERKTLADLVATLTSGKLKFLLADLSSVPRAAVVVEDRWSQVFKLDRVRPAIVAAGIAECQVRYPNGPDPVLRNPPPRTGMGLPVLRRRRRTQPPQPGRSRVGSKPASGPARNAGRTLKRGCTGVGNRPGVGGIRSWTATP
jgi:hypothetical protein